MCTSGLIILKLILEVGLPQWENPKQIRRCMDGSSVGNQKFYKCLPQDERRQMKYRKIKRWASGTEVMISVKKLNRDGRKECEAALESWG